MRGAASAGLSGNFRNPPKDSGVGQIFVISYSVTTFSINFLFLFFLFVLFPLLNTICNSTHYDVTPSRAEGVFLCWGDSTL